LNLLASLFGVFTQTFHGVASRRAERKSSNQQQNGYSLEICIHGDLLVAKTGALASDKVWSNFLMCRTNNWLEFDPATSLWICLVRVRALAHLAVLVLVGARITHV